MHCLHFSTLVYPVGFHWAPRSVSWGFSAIWLNVTISGVRAFRMFVILYSRLPFSLAFCSASYQWKSEHVRITLVVPQTEVNWTSCIRVFRLQTVARISNEASFWNRTSSTVRRRVNRSQVKKTFQSIREGYSYSLWLACKCRSLFIMRVILTENLMFVG